MNNKFKDISKSPEFESNLISVREAEATHPPPCFAAAAVPSGMDCILSGSTRTKSFRAASSPPESPLTWSKLFKFNKHAITQSKPLYQVFGLHWMNHLFPFQTNKHYVRLFMNHYNTKKLIKPNKKKWKPSKLQKQLSKSYNVYPAGKT